MRSSGFESGNQPPEKKFGGKGYLPSHFQDHTKVGALCTEYNLLDSWGDGRWSLNHKYGAPQRIPLLLDRHLNPLCFLVLLNSKACSFSFVK